MKKRILFIVAFVMMLSIANLALAEREVSARVTESSIIPKEAIEYASDHYKDVLSNKIESVYGEDKLLEGKDLTLGKPSVIVFDPQKCLHQDRIFYFPLYDQDGCICLVMSVIETTDGWTCCFSREWLNEFDRVYRKGKENIFLVDDSSSKMFLKRINKKQFDELDISLNTVDINSRIHDENDVLEYAPGFYIDTDNSKKCSLYNARGQGGNKLCWAASAATIINYIKGRSVTTMDVARAANVVNEGASLSVTRKTMEKFDLFYPYVVNGYISWDLIKKCIKQKKPVYCAASCYEGGHAVVNHGYTVSAGEKYVIFWNPGINGGKGGEITSSFRANGTLITYYGHAYTWDAYLSYYRKD